LPLAEHATAEGAAHRSVPAVRPPPWAGDFGAGAAGTGTARSGGGEVGGDEAAEKDGEED